MLEPSNDTNKIELLKKQLENAQSELKTANDNKAQEENNLKEWGERLKNVSEIQQNTPIYENNILKAQQERLRLQQEITNIELEIESRGKIKSSATTHTFQKISNQPPPTIMEIKIKGLEDKLVDLNQMLPNKIQSLNSIVSINQTRMDMARNAQRELNDIHSAKDKSTERIEEINTQIEGLNSKIVNIKSELKVLETGIFRKAAQELRNDGLKQSFQSEETEEIHPTNP